MILSNRLGAATQERNPTSTLTTHPNISATCFCWVALPLHPTYHYPNISATCFCWVALPLHPTYQ